MERRIVKTLFRGDGERRVEIYERDDGLFSFTEDMRALTYDGEPCWTPVWPSPSPICDSAETAESEALARVDWLSG
jgi:hypothetical protein